MVGNKNLKQAGPPGGPPVLKFEGPIVNGQCWIEVDVGNPLAPPPRQTIRVKALIDTGATSSSINDALAAQLGITGRGKAQIQGAGGLHACNTAPAMIGFKLANGNIIGRSIDVAILPMSVPLLFGMSEITPGYLVVDGVNGVWRWTLQQSGVRRKPSPPPPPPQTQGP